MARWLAAVSSKRPTFTGFPDGRSVHDGEGYCFNVTPDGCGSSPRLFQRFPYLLEVFKRVIFVHPVGLQEYVHLQPGQAQHAAKFRLGEPPGLQFFNGKSFQRPARKIATTCLG